MSKKKIVKNILSLALIQIANFIMPLISVPVISRIIGPENFGINNFVGAFIIYFNLFIGYGFNLTATRKLAKDTENTDLRNTIFSEVLYCQIILFLISIATYTVLLFTIPALSDHKLVAIYAFLFCISSVLTQNWIFQAMQDLSKVTVLNLLGKFVYLAMVLLFIKSKDDYYWQPLSLSITQIIIGIFSFIWAKKQYHINIIHISLRQCMNTLWDEKTIFFSLIVTTLYTTANIVILGLLKDQTDVGYYTAGQRLIAIVQTVITLPLAQVFFPHIGRAFAESYEKGLSNVQKLIPIVLIMTIILGLAIILIGPFALNLFYGDKFSPSIPVFQILAFIPLFNALNNILGIQLMVNMKMDSLYLKIVSYVSIISIVFNFYMISKWSYIGCAINWIITEIVILIVMYMNLKFRSISIIDVSLFNKHMFKGLIYFKNK
ncbi:MAG: flippase [Siphonobacter sp.]